MFYYIVFIILCFFTVLDLVNIPKSKKTIFYLLIVAFFIIISGLRWNTGNDWIPYKYFIETFDWENNLQSRYMFEPGFAIFARIITSVFGNSFTNFLICFAIVNIGIKSHFIYKNVNAIFIGLLSFWSLSSFAEITAVRQALAISICIISVSFIIKKKIVYFLLTVFLAMQIHASSFIFFFAYWIYHARWSVKSKVIYLLVFILFAFMGSARFFMQFVTTVLPDFGYLSDRANAYFEMGADKTYNSGVSKLGQLILGIAKRLIILPFIFVFEAKVFHNSLKFKSFSNLFLFGNLIYFLVGDFLTLQRLSTYFYFFEIVLICWIFESLKKYRGLALLIIIAYSFLKVVFTLQSAPTYQGVNLLDPYIWIFSDDTFREMF